jgi:hypothetical protein
METLKELLERQQTEREQLQLVHNLQRQVWNAEYRANERVEHDRLVTETKAKLAREVADSGVLIRKAFVQLQDDDFNKRSDAYAFLESRHEKVVETWRQLLALQKQERDAMPATRVCHESDEGS